MERVPEEPRVIRKKLKIKNITTGMPAGTRIVSSGPPPQERDLPSAEPPPGEETRVEPEMPHSPMYPTTKPPREDIPMGGVPSGDRD